MYRTVSPRLGRQCCPWPCAARRFERIANAGRIGLHHSRKRLEVADCALGLRLGKLDEIGYDEIGYDEIGYDEIGYCLLYTSPSPRD